MIRLNHNDLKVGWKRPVARMLGVCFFASAAYPTHALAQVAAAPTDVSTMIDNLRNQVISAFVVVGPRGNQTFHLPLTEKDLSKVSCTYTIAQETELSRLMDMLSNAGIKEEPKQARSIDARFAIYLKLRDGTTNTVLVDRNSPSHGVYNGQVSITAREGFEPDLRIVVARLTPTATNPICEDSR